jgi:hypothetical protein
VRLSPLSLHREGVTVSVLLHVILCCVHNSFSLLLLCVQEARGAAAAALKDSLAPLTTTTTTSSSSSGGGGGGGVAEGWRDPGKRQQLLRAYGRQRVSVGVGVCVGGEGG